MQITLKQLEAFIWVADLASFKAAAARLNTTQPNISARIAALEDILQTTLLERDSGSVRLTIKGEELLHHARDIITHVDDMMSAVEKSEIHTGVLKLGVTEMIVHTWLRDFLNKMKDYFPNIAVELTVDISVNLSSMLYGRSLDLAIQNKPFDRDVSGHVHVGNYPLIWVASPTLEMPLSKTCTHDEIVRYPILSAARKTQIYNELQEHFTLSALQPARLIACSHLGASLHMAIDGMGIAALPEAMVRDDIKSGALIALNYQWSPSSLDFYARFEKAKTPHYVQSAAELACQCAKDFGS